MVTANHPIQGDDIGGGNLLGQGDKIDLSAIDANTGIADDQAFTWLAEGDVFKNNPGKLYFDQQTHILYGNIDSDSAAEFYIQLTGVSNLIPEAFWL